MAETSEILVAQPDSNSAGEKQTAKSGDGSATGLGLLCCPEHSATSYCTWAFQSVQFLPEAQGHLIVRVCCFFLLTLCTHTVTPFYMISSWVFMDDFCHCQCCRRIFGFSWDLKGNIGVAGGPAGHSLQFLIRMQSVKLNYKTVSDWNCVLSEIFSWM